MTKDKYEVWNYIGNWRWKFVRFDRFCDAKFYAVINNCVDIFGPNKFYWINPLFEPVVIPNHFPNAT